MRDFGGVSLEHPRQWLGARWLGLCPGCAELRRAARRALRRHGGRAGALPTGHFDHVAVRQPLERGVAHLGTVALGEERDHLEDSTSRVELGPLCGTNREWA